MSTLGHLLIVHVHDGVTRMAGWLSLDNARDRAAEDPSVWDAWSWLRKWCKEHLDFGPEGYSYGGRRPAWRECLLVYISDKKDPRPKIGERVDIEIMGRPLLAFEAFAEGADFDLNYSELDDLDWELIYNLIGGEDV